MRKSARLRTITFWLVLVMAGCHRGPDMDLNVECVQLRPATSTLDLDAWDSHNNMGRAVHDEVRRLQLRYEMRGASGGTYFETGENRPATHVLLLVTEPVKQAADLPVPRQGGDVVYLFRDGRWQPSPAAVTNASSHIIRIRPDASRPSVFTIDVTGMGSWNHRVTLELSKWPDT